MANKKSVSSKLFLTVTAVLCVLCLALGLLWAKTADDSRVKTARMETLCTQSAHYASTAFHTYLEISDASDTDAAQTETDADAYFRSATADYNVFLCMYFTLYGGDEGGLADYMMLYEIYSHLLQNPDSVLPHLHEFVHALSELSADIENAEALGTMETIRDALKEADKAAAADAAVPAETEEEA